MKCGTRWARVTQLFSGELICICICIDLDIVERFSKSIAFVAYEDILSESRWLLGLCG